MRLRKVNYYLIHLLWFLSMKIGQCIFLFKTKKIYKFDQLEEIVINRSDRIGDATMTKPLILLFIDYLQEEWYNGAFTVLTSSINKSVFQEFPWKVEVVDETLKIESSNIFEITAYKIYQWVKSFWMCLTQGKTIRRSLLIDLVGWWDMNVLHHYYKNGYTSMVSCNLSFSSILLSNWISTPFTTFQGKRNLMETYIDLIESTFDLRWRFREYVYSNIHAFYPEYDASDLSQKSGVLIFVWCKWDRNFSISKWTEIIDHFAQNFPGPVTVIDDNLNTYYTALSNVQFPSDVKIQENKFSLTEFKQFASGFEWLVWLDGWGMNHIRTVANNITIYTLADYNIWSAFVGYASYKIHKTSGEWFVGETLLNIHGKQLRNCYAAKRSFGDYENFDITPIYEIIFHNNW